MIRIRKCSEDLFEVFSKFDESLCPWISVKFKFPKNRQDVGEMLNSAQVSETFRTIILEISLEFCVGF